MKNDSESSGTKREAASRSVHRRAQPYPHDELREIDQERDSHLLSQYNPLACRYGETAVVCARRQELERNMRATRLTDQLTRKPKPPVIVESNPHDESFRELMPTPADRKKIKEGDSPFHFDSGKPRMDQLPPRALMAIAEVFGYGARKYGEWNWAEYSNDWKWGQIIGSLLRHTFSWLMNEDYDPESGLHHMAHAGCNVMMLLELILNGRGGDDRNPIYKE